MRSPNWLAATPREAFFTLGRFAVADSRRGGQPMHVGAHLRPGGIAERFAGFAEHVQPGIEFLREAVGYGVSVLGFEPDAWVLELAQGALGDDYPLPERMLPHCEDVVRAFFVRRLCGQGPPPGRFDLFATEGGRAAVGYAVRTLVANRLLTPGDRVAVANSVLVPYLETPGLGTSGFEVVDVSADPDEDWQFPDAEIDKLADPGVKAFFLANPAHPHLHALRERTADRIAAIVRQQRPELLVISDESFGTFVEGFRSLAGILPASTMSVYSFSRHFGSTGWRLAIAAVHRDNAFDLALDELPDEVRIKLDQRYAAVNSEAAPLRFIDRMVAESRSVAFRPAAGLSRPQQVQLALFALFFLSDTGEEFIDATTTLIASRLGALYRALGLPSPRVGSAVPYYAVLDLLELARRRHGDAFASWLRRVERPEDLVASLGSESVVVLPAGRPNTSRWIIRVSMADCSAEECAELGSRLIAIVEQMQTARRDRARSRRARRPHTA